MFTHLVWMTLLIAAQGGPPVQKPSGDYSPPDVPIPLPLYESRPDCGGLVLFVGSTCGAGWKFADGSEFNAWFDCGARTTGLTCRKTVYDTETTRGYVVSGTRGGFVHEWYLGQGIAARLDLSGSHSPLHLDVDWYPVEGVALTIGFDPLRGRWDWAWQLIF